MVMKRQIKMITGMFQLLLARDSRADNAICIINIPQPQRQRNYLEKGINWAIIQDFIIRRHRSRARSFFLAVGQARCSNSRNGKKETPDIPGHQTDRHQQVPEIKMARPWSLYGEHGF
uniref:Putative secreted peptide n=1 Tax=Anopheles braziliensis TaxID=58242 RepID=A0A2M3ZTK9_9DIPT